MQFSFSHRNARKHSSCILLRERGLKNHIVCVLGNVCNYCECHSVHAINVDLVAENFKVVHWCFILSC